MADNSDIPYSPPQYLVSRSVLPPEQLISEFESFKRSLPYISRAPEIVFERLIGNINETVIVQLQQQRETQLAEAAEAGERNVELQRRVENLERTEQENIALQERVRSLEAEVEALRAELTNASSNLQPADPSLSASATRSDSGTQPGPDGRSHVVRRGPRARSIPQRVAPTSGTPLHFYFSPTGKSTFVNVPPGEAHDLAFLYQNGGTWLDLAHPGIKLVHFSGNWMTPDQEQLPSLVTAEIVFPENLSSIPVVVVWFTGLDMSNDEPWRVKVYATNITQTGFVLNIEALRTSVLYSAGVSWLAYRRCHEALSGALPASGRDGWKQRSNYSNIYVSASTGGSDPRTAVFCNALEVQDVTQLSLRTNIIAEDWSGFRWEMTGVTPNLVTLGADFLRLS